MSDSIYVSITPLSQFGDLGRVWRDLEARAASNFFLSWYWIGPWLNTVQMPPFVLVARASGQVVGLALLGYSVVRRHFGLLRVPTIYLNQSGDPGQDVTTIEYNGILTDRTLSNEVWQTCLRHLLALDWLPDGRRCDALAWNGASEEALGHLDQSNSHWRIVAEAPSARVDLAALRAARIPYLDSLSSNTRRQIRRAMTLYRELYGPLRLTVAADVKEAHAFFHAAGGLHQARWRSRSKPGAFAYPFYVRFHERVIAAGMPAGSVELACICAGDTPIGYLYNFLYREQVYYYFSGFRYEADNRLKPGLVSHTMCIEQHVARRMRVYDFMAGHNQYKTSLGQPGPRIVGAVAERPRLGLRLEAVARAAKQRAPALIQSDERSRFSLKIAR